MRQPVLCGTPWPPMWGALSVPVDFWVWWTMSFSLDQKKFYGSKYISILNWDLATGKMIVCTLSWGGRDPSMLEAQIGPYSFKNYDKTFIKTRQSPKHFLHSCSDSLQGHHLISVHERMGYWRPHLVFSLSLKNMQTGNMEAWVSLLAFMIVAEAKWTTSMLILYVFLESNWICFIYM